MCTILDIGGKLNSNFTSRSGTYITNRDASSKHSSLTTIATFFSAITATTLQFSFQQTDTTLDNLVNALWLLSLVFSISSAINSLLSMAWSKAAK